MSLCEARFPFFPAHMTINRSVWLRLKRHFAGAATFTAHRLIHALLPLRLLEQAVAFQPRQPRFGILEHLGVLLQPPHHVEEAFRPFSLPFSKRLVTQIANLIQIRDLHQPLRLASHLHAANALFPVNLLQVSYSNVENAALANVYRLVRLHFQLFNQLSRDA